MRGCKLLCLLPQLAMDAVGSHDGATCAAANAMAGQANRSTLPF